MLLLGSKQENRVGNYKHEFSASHLRWLLKCIESTWVYSSWSLLCVCFQIPQFCVCCEFQFAEQIRIITLKMKNALSVDLEDYYQVTAFADSVGPANWNDRPSRIEANTEKLLQLFEEAACHATFFTVGWIAEKYPKLVRRVAEAGHEIACHSYLHRLVYSLSEVEFKQDTKRAKELLENASGGAVYGYRAPSFSITVDSLWAFEVLAELGFTYDSSIYPIEHLNYGMPRGPRLPFRVQTSAGDIVEFPMPTVMFGKRRSPIGGGAYLRLLPYEFTRWGIRYINKNECHPVCIYVHPWELDVSQPRLRGSWTAHLRHYFGLKSTEAKIRRLLSDFELVPLGEIVGQLDPEPLDLAALFQPANGNLDS